MNNLSEIQLPGKLIYSNPRFVERPYPWLQHAPFGFFLVEVVKPEIFVELGTHSGNSYFAFCQAVDSLKLKTRCYAVDTWEGDDHSGFYGKEVFDRVKEINANHFQQFSYLLKMKFDDALSYFEDASIDLLHIDGMHSYDAVKHDFDSWLPKMGPKGVVVFHDTNVREREFGVWKFFGELKSKYPAFEFLHGHGLGVVCVGAKVKTAFLQFIDQANQNTNVQQLFSTLGNRVLALRERDDITKERSELKTEFTQAKKLLDKKQGDLDTLKESISGKNEELQALKKKISIIQDQQRSQQDNSLKDKERINQLQLQLSSVKEEVLAKQGQKSILEEKFKLQSEQLVEKQERIAELEEQIKSQDDQSVERIKEISELKDTEIRLKKDLEIQRAEIEKEKKNNLGLINNNNDLVKENEELETSIRLIKKSLSYRFTKPFRYLGKLFFRFRKYLYLPFSLIKLLITFNLSGIKRELRYIKYIRIIKRSGRFDVDWYLKTYPDVRDSGVDPVSHYVRYGAQEGRDPAPDFKTQFYIQTYEDVAYSDINPLVHYILFGGQENRVTGEENSIDGSNIVEHQKNTVKNDNDDSNNLFSDIIDYDDEYIHDVSKINNDNDPQLSDVLKLKHIAQTIYYNLRSRHRENRLLKQKASKKEISFNYKLLNFFYKKRERKDFHVCHTGKPHWEEKLLKHFHVKNKAEYEAGEFAVKKSPDKIIEFSYKNRFGRLKRFHNLSAEYKNLPGETAVFGMMLVPIGNQPFLEIPIAGLLKGYIAIIEVELLNYSDSHFALLYTVDSDREYNKEKAQFRKLSAKDNGKKTKIISYKLGTTHLKGPLRLFPQNTKEPFWLVSIQIKLFHKPKPQNPFFSFIVPCYNHGPYVKEAVDSILQITDDGSYEVIIIDDGSTDKKCVEILNHLARDKRVSLIRQKNSGLGRARNVGIIHSKGKYILPVDADNKIRPAYYHNSIELFETDPELGVVFSDVWFFGEKEFRKELGPHEKSHQFIQNQIDACAVFRREVWEQVGGYQEEMIGYQDWEFWTAVDSLNYWRFYHLNKIGFDYRKLSGSMVSHTKLFSSELLDFISSRHVRLLKGLHKKLYCAEKNRQAQPEEINMQVGLNFYYHNNSSPLVSIIAPNYNKERYLRLRLNSILKQTYKNFELIILDDASTDNSVEVIQGLVKGNQKVRLEISDANSENVFKQWRKGIDMAKGDIIWIAECDDYSDTSFLAELVPYLSNSKNINIAYCQSNFVNSEGLVFDNHLSILNRLHNKLWNNDFIAEGKSFVRDYMATLNCMPNASGVIFNKELSSILDWEEIFSYKVCGDWHIWTKFLSKSDLYFSSKPLNYFRFDSNTQRNKEGGDLTRIHEHLMVLRMICEEVGLDDSKKRIAIDHILNRAKSHIENNNVPDHQVELFLNNVFLLKGNMSFSYQKKHD